MGQSTEELSRDIEATRAGLSRDVDELGNKISPHQMMHRKKRAMRSRLSSMRDSLMGGATQAGQQLSSAGTTVQNRTGEMGGSAVGAVQTRTGGNPLIMGGLAFGAGFLLSALLPATRVEAQTSRRAVEVAKDHAEPVAQHAREAGRELAENLKGRAEEAAGELRETAQGSVDTVKDEARASVENVQERTQQS